MIIRKWRRVAIDTVCGSVTLSLSLVDLVLVALLCVQRVACDAFGLMAPRPPAGGLEPRPSVVVRA
eukprot:scaffold9267_cov112-Isochrysis_galbana.AAC.5